jgi:tryptophan 2,3-dioxygenase
MHKNQGPVYYHDYLMLDQFLGSQKPLSLQYATKENPEAHEETLFIIVHQAYELWFKQILHDLNSALKIFNQKAVNDNELGTIVQRLERITKIQAHISGQLEILETMTPMDFLEFRNLLIPASGFQSTQFREIEIKLGLNTHDRQSIDREFFLGRLNQKDRERLTSLEGSLSLLKLVEAWLERIPFTQTKGFDFWAEYKKSIHFILEDDEKTIQSNLANLSEPEKKMQIENLKATRDTFDSLFNEEAHEALVKAGQRKISRQAILNALFILLYRDEPMLAMPCKMISLMMDIDENFTAWRYRHALLAQRMLGTKIGTGGSSGHQYLKRAADNNRVFVDFFNLSTYLIPRSQLPQIPAEVKRQLNFGL